MEQVLATGEQVTIMHFIQEVMTAPADDEPEGPPSMQWRIACMPNMREFHQTVHHPVVLRTNEPRAVSCPECKKTSAYQKAMRPYK